MSNNNSSNHPIIDSIAKFIVFIKWEVLYKSPLRYDDVLIPSKPGFKEEPFRPWDWIKKQWKKYWDPIIFDLNNDGKLETIDITNGIYIDYANDGFAEASAWVGRNDGILVVDSNNNDEIDNGTELVTADNIAEYDTNEDGIIDSNDTNFNNLKILKGDSTLLSLAEAGIASINLSTTQVGIPDENGNEQVYEATYTKADGTTGKYGEFLLNTDTTSSVATEWIEETSAISVLPDLVGKGSVYSLHQAMLRDTSGDLQELVEDFVSETDDSERHDVYPI